jgi:hypothetical protein
MDHLALDAQMFTLIVLLAHLMQKTLFATLVLRGLELLLPKPPVCLVIVLMTSVINVVVIVYALNVLQDTL